MWDLGLHIPHYPPQVWLVCGGCCAQTVVQVSVSESIALFWLDKSHSWKGTFTHIGWPETCQNLLCTKRDIAVGIARYTKHPEIHHGFISITLGTVFIFKLSFRLRHFLFTDPVSCFSVVLLCARCRCFVLPRMTALLCAEGAALQVITASGVQCLWACKSSVLGAEHCRAMKYKSDINTTHPLLVRLSNTACASSPSCGQLLQMIFSHRNGHRT